MRPDYFFSPDLTTKLQDDIFHAAPTKKYYDSFPLKKTKMLSEGSSREGEPPLLSI